MDRKTWHLYLLSFAGISLRYQTSIMCEAMYQLNVGDMPLPSISSPWFNAS